MSIQAYQNAVKRTESPRQTEYRAFAQATRGLIDAASLPADEVGRRAEALATNRRLWSLLAADCAAEGNQLSQALRAQIISLSIFVDRHSSAVMRQGAPLEILIEINRSIMQGLSPAQPAMASAQP